MSEIALDDFPVLRYVPNFEMQFNHFVEQDGEPLVFGLRSSATIAQK